MEIYLSEIQVVDRALGCLRQIRGSVFPSAAFPNSAMKSRTAVRDAEKIGMVVASYLIDPTAHEEPSTSGPGNLKAVFASLESKYQVYTEFQRSRGKNINVVLERFASNLQLFRLLTSTPTSIRDDWGILMGSHNKRLMPLLDICNDRLGIVAPLSTDYLWATFIHRFIQKHTNLPCFRLKPVITDTRFDQTPGTIVGQKDNQFGGNIDEIAIWTDLDVFGNTRSATEAIVRQLYPYKLRYGMVSPRHL